jgi:hypothetical protein
MGMVRTGDKEFENDTGIYRDLVLARVSQRRNLFRFHGREGLFVCVFLRENPDEIPAGTHSLRMEKLVSIGTPEPDHDCR